MDTTFISYCLTFCLAIILVLYLYQITDGNRIKYTNPNNHNKNLKNINGLTFMNDSSLHKENHNRQSKTCMPIHPVGPVYNFHQSFNKYKHMPCVGIPTGIPEMGWRNLYLENYSHNEVVEEDPFSGIPTRNFLDNLDNVKNIYREEC